MLRELASSCGEDADPARFDTETFYYGFDGRPEKAWRAPSSNTTRKEWTDNLFCESGAQGDDFAKATFADGATHVITDATCLQLNHLRKVNWATHRGPLWTGDHSDGELTIYQKKDRGDLVSSH